ncbi:hypothetical protein JTB14_036920 [Gonioctena quinquepunctata]|nr:hypothetical protein JTB14_036920 [Gonioctena quinquepunctata]
MVKEEPTEIKSFSEVYIKSCLEQEYGIGDEQENLQDNQFDTGVEMKNDYPDYFDCSDKREKLTIPLILSKDIGPPTDIDILNQEMENTSFKPTRKNAGINKSLSVDYIWPEKFGISNRNTLAEKADTTMSLVSLDRHDQKSVTSSKGKVCEETVSVTSSKRSQATLNLRKMRLSLKTEKVRQQLEKQQELLQQKQREVENQMRLIRMEHDLHEAELEVMFESNEFHSSGISEASSRLLNVQEWIEENIELPATEENKLSPIEIEEDVTRHPEKCKIHEICRPADKTSVISVKAKQTSNNESSVLTESHTRNQLNSRMHKLLMR